VSPATPAPFNRPNVSVTERGANLLALLACLEILPANDTGIRTLLDRCIRITAWQDHIELEILALPQAEVLPVGPTMDRASDHGPTSRFGTSGNGREAQ
jgi:hypothetical protein